MCMRCGVLLLLSWKGHRKGENTVEREVIHREERRHLASEITGKEAVGISDGKFTVSTYTRFAFHAYTRRHAGLSIAVVDFLSSSRDYKRTMYVYIL